MSPEIDVKVDVEIWCGCGEWLCNQSRDASSRSQHRIEVEPCEKCLDRAREAEYQKGYDKGHNEGYCEGERDGVDIGRSGSDQ